MLIHTFQSVKFVEESKSKSNMRKNNEQSFSLSPFVWSHSIHRQSSHPLFSLCFIPFCYITSFRFLHFGVFSRSQFSCLCSSFSIVLVSSCVLVSFDTYALAETTNNNKMPAYPTDWMNMFVYNFISMFCVAYMPNNIQKKGNESFDCEQLELWKDDDFFAFLWTV